MPEERRNLYRILHVQPEAPAEVLKASYRTLMSTLRTHPDLGGDPQAAARINAAYEILSDPQRRLAYDRTLVKPRGPAAPGAPESAAVDGDPAAWLADRCCPFCRTPLPATLRSDTRCVVCDSPLTHLRSSEHGELFGRRRSPRNSRPMTATLRLSGRAGDFAARLHDLSLNGICVNSQLPARKRSAMRVITSSFDAVAVVVGCRRIAEGYSLHGELLTLQLLRSSGVFISAKA